MKTEDKDKIRNILKNKRLEKGYTMKDLSKIVGVSEGTISRWESGDIDNMKRDKIVSLARALSISPAIIMGWNEELPGNVMVPAGNSIPILGTICCGDGVINDQSYDGRFYLDSSIHADYSV